jgi:molybdopterin-guanine dinucleotide biosynthesis protein A
MDLTAGFVLTGGRSSRMGRDKALLPIPRSSAAGSSLPASASSLVERTAEWVREAAASVTLIGMPQRYAHLGLPVVADLVPDCGPIGGLYTALNITPADWNLIVACDMPALTADFLCRLLAAARQSPSLCLVPETASGLHPLCAVYHRRALPAVRSAIDHKRFKMHDLLKSLAAVSWPVADPLPLCNVNTPLEWEAQGAR